MQTLHTQEQEALDSLNTQEGRNNQMKTALLLFTVMAGFLVVGIVNAGSGPLRSAARSGGCACQQAYTMQATEGGCYSSPMVQPVYRGGCACNSRVTLSERSLARRAARANYDRTMAAFIAAAGKGDLQSPCEGPELSTMEQVPVEEANEAEAACDCCDKCKTKEG